MSGAISKQDFPCAGQQRKSDVDGSLGRTVPSVLGRCTLAVLLSVALLGAASAVREFDLSIVKRRVEGSASTIFGAAADLGARPKKHREIALLYLEVLPQ